MTTRTLLILHIASLLHGLSSGQDASENETMTRASPCPIKPDVGVDFLNIGHSAGEPLRHCENTLEAGRAGLAQGMNSVEVDVCMSRDGVIFLWHDCNMYNALSMLRRLGKFAPNSDCLPYHHPSTYNKQPHQLTFATIQRHYGYKSEYDTNERLSYVVPTLQEFLRQIGTSPQIKKIFVDVKITDRLMEHFMTSLIALAREMDVEGKLSIGFSSKDSLKRMSELAVVRQSKARLALDIGLTLEEIGGRHFMGKLREATKILEEALADSYSVGYWDKIKIGYYLFRSVASITKHAIFNLRRIYKEQTMKRQPLTRAQDLCITYVWIGITPLPDILGHDLYKDTLKKAVEDRRERGYPAKIIAWTINDEDLLRWIASSGVDGVITDKPGILGRSSGEKK